MENNVDILNELKQLSPVIAGMEKINVFTVPVGYFENLSEDILTGIASEKGSGIITLPDFPSADIPLGYFDTLADTILGKIKVQNASDELRVLSPMLYSIQNENVFEVPQGYFNTLTDEIVARVKPQQTKVVTMHRRSSTIMKYAVAAAFTGVMALGVFKFTGNSTEKTELPEYVTIGLNNIKDVDQELAKISDDDIVKYLEANGTDVEAAILANSVDENELPSQEDYLLDDKALDKYLNSINVKELKN